MAAASVDAFLPQSQSHIPSVSTVKLSQDTNRRIRSVSLFLGRNVDDDYSPAIATSEKSPEGSLVAATGIATVAALYWYWMVFGASANEAGLPFLPEWLPLVPGWPPSDADLAPAIEDSKHFFYISDAIESFSSANGSVSGDSPPALRLALFNIAEAWIFAMLPLLLADKRRLPLSVVLATWFGALGLTNAFLAPYLAFRELFAALGELESDVEEADADVDAKMDNQNRVLSVGFGLIASLVGGYAFLQLPTNSAEQWKDFGSLVATDRTYLAFCVDLVLFSFFQVLLTTRVASQASGSTVTPNKYKIPFIGLMAWLFD